METTTLSASADELPFNVVQNFFDEETPVQKSSATPLIGFGDLLRPLSTFSLPTLPPLQQFPTLPTLPPLQFIEDLSRQQKFVYTTENPTKTRQFGGPRFVNQSSASIPPEHIKMWRRRFYKVFKEIKNQFKPADSDENLKDTRKLVEEDAMSTAQQIQHSRSGFPVEHSGYGYKTDNRLKRSLK